MTRSNMTFEEDVVDRLARIETLLVEVPLLRSRVSSLEAHRNALVGALGVITTVGGWLFSSHH